MPELTPGPASRHARITPGRGLKILTAAPAWRPHRYYCRYYPGYGEGRINREELLPVSIHPPRSHAGPGGLRNFVSTLGGLTSWVPFPVFLHDPEQLRGGMLAGEPETTKFA